MITIRTAELTDIKRVQELHTKLFEFEDSFIKLYNSEYDISKDSDKYFTSRVNTKEGRIFLAVDGDEIVGYLCAGIGKENYRNVHPYAEIESLFVLETYRGQSVGAQLMAAFKQWVKEQNIKRIKVEVVNTNDRSIKYYFREGFKPTYLELEATIEE